MNIIHKSYKFKIAPDKEQKKLLTKHFGACRFVFNSYLNSRKKSLTYCDNASINIKIQGLKIGTGLGTNSDIKQKRTKALPLGESLSSEVTPISFAVAG